MASKYVNIHPEVDMLDRDLSFIAGNIGSSLMERIARHYMDFTDADLQHCRIDADRKHAEFSYHYSYAILKLWVKKNKGPQIQRRLFEKLEEVRNDQDHLIPITAYYDVLEMWVSKMIFFKQLGKQSHSLCSLHQK